MAGADIGGDGAAISCDSGGSRKGRRGLGRGVRGAGGGAHADAPAGRWRWSLRLGLCLKALTWERRSHVN